MPSPSRVAARRQAVTTLEVAGAVASYAARQISADGLSPQEAQAAALEVALELESVVLALLRLAGRPRPLDTVARRELAVRFTAAGVPTAQVAARLGVDPRTVRKWRHRAAGLPRSVTRGSAGILGPVNASGPGGATNTVIRGLTANEVRLWIILSACPAACPAARWRPSGRRASCPLSARSGRRGTVIPA